MEDALLKASNAGAQFFFTWNVNRLVLFDSKKWEVPLYERRVKVYDLGTLSLIGPGRGAARGGSCHQLFLAQFFGGLEGHLLEGTEARLGNGAGQVFHPCLRKPYFVAREAYGGDALGKFRQEQRLSMPTCRSGWPRTRGGFHRNDPKVWREMTARAARTLCYVFSNRLLFYEWVPAPSSMN